jgi:DNA-binding PadR family transcriptional regulator
VSPVFRHGRLRLYLLKLLDEAPRHGYEVIRLLQDRFMGVYAPSPGTIYPRLARLEEDGLVTHEEIDGKKVYSITDKGREEIRSRLGELADIEDELSESLRDVAREISEDVRDTVRTIREELASAAREFRSQQAGGHSQDQDEETTEGEPGAGEAKDGPSDEARRIRDEARRNREQMRAGFRGRGRNRGDWKDWAGDWGGRPDWASWTSWGDWAGGVGGGSGAGHRPHRGGPNPFSDLERIAIQFATELRAAARQTGGLGERSLNDLRDILTDTLAKVRDEVFTGAGSPDRDSDTDAPESEQAAATPETEQATNTDTSGEHGPSGQPGQSD